MMSTQALNVRNLKKSFGKKELSNLVLNDISFSINKGEYVAFCGPSGCGKSTLLNILSLLDEVDSGEYILDGQNVTFLSDKDKAKLRSQKVGIVFQSFNLIDEITVAENVALPLRYQGMNTRRRLERANECLRKVGLEDKSEFFPHQLSGGQQQRVSIARALAANPSILLVDEPTGNLDSVNGDIIMELLWSLNQSGTTICLVTHDTRYVKHAGRRIDLMDGKIVAEHLTSELL